MSNYGVKISKKGENVRTVTDPRSFVERSNVNMLKIAKEGTGTTNFGSGFEYDKVVTHNLGYKPLVVLFFEHPIIKKWASVPANFIHDEGGGLETGVSGTAFHQNDDNVVLRFVSTSNLARDVTYKYFILIEPRKDAWYE